MGAVNQLGYLGIGVKDINEWEKYAQEILGLQVSKRGSDGSLFLRMDEYQHRIVVHPNGNDDIAYAGWQVTGETELLEIAERLRNDGVSVHEASNSEAQERQVARLIKTEDPDGIPVEIFYGPLINFDEPFKSPRPISGFITGDQGLGHIVLCTEDLDKGLHFYQDLLGMRISDYIKPNLPSGQEMILAFFHCNSRHHSLALMPPRGKKLLHFMLQLESINDVGMTFDLCRDRKVPKLRGLGRHTNDHMLSFYMGTPSGFEVEYGWGARTVDDSTWQVQWQTTGSIWGHRPVESEGAKDPIPA